MQLIGPVPDDLVLCHRPVVDLILEDVIASGSIPILIKDDWSPCTSWTKQQSNKKEQNILFSEIDGKGKHKIKSYPNTRKET